MTIPLLGTGGLFTVLGRAGKILRDLSVYQQTALPTDLASLQAQLTTQQSLSASITAAFPPYITSAGSIATQIQIFAQSVLNAYVVADVPQPTPNNLVGNLQILINQMIAGSASVQVCAVTAPTSAYSTNVGNGSIVVSTLRGDGLVQQNLFAEAANIVCVADAQTGGAAVGNERFTYYGQAAAAAGAFDPAWPAGSGAQASITAVDATQSAAGGNLLTNSGFETYTVTNVPDGWVIAVGTAQISKSTSSPYSGTACLKIAGDSSTLTALSQTFAVAAATPPTGTTSSLVPDTVYLVNVFLKADVVPAAGVLKVELTDGSGTVTTDDQGASNALSVTLSGITTGWVAHTAAFRTPKVLPAALKIRVRLTTALSTGSNLFVDHMALATATRLYAGGPLAAIFSSPTAFIMNDGWTFTPTNDRGGSTYSSTFQTLFDRLFNMRANGLLLPSSGSPTIADTLITS